MARKKKPEEPKAAAVLLPVGEGDLSPAEEQLWVEVQRIRALLSLRLAEARDGDASEAREALSDLEAEVGRRREGPATVDGEIIPLLLLAERLHLGPVHLDVLVATLAPHLDPDIPGLYRELRGGLWSEHVDGAVLLRLFSRTWKEALAVRRAIGPQSPLLRHRLLQVVHLPAGASALQAVVTVHPRILHYVLGEEGLHHLIASFCEVEVPRVPLGSVILPDDLLQRVLDVVEPHRDLGAHLSRWGYDRVLAYGRGTALLFVGPPGTGKTLLAHAVAAHLELTVLRVFVGKMLRADVPAEEILAELEVESRLRGAMLLFDDCAPLFSRRGPALSAMLAFLEHYDGLSILATNHSENVDLALERRVLLRVDFKAPDAGDRERIYEVLLPPDVPIDAGTDIQELASAYDFPGGSIKNTVMVALNKALARDPKAPHLDMKLLREAAELQLRNRLDDYAVVGSGKLTMKDIVLPPRVEEQVVELLHACRNHSFVLNSWGFAERLVTGRGIVAVFDGPPGTGKTLCAEILGTELALPVSRINIPAVVSKWVGETEQHIQDIFRRAQASRTVLLFDEADALFGKRVENVERATDRYANMEVNLLLQEIERYDGIVLLTTNLFSALDDAALRRIQFRITFPEPDVGLRTRIWQTLMPPRAPLEDNVDFEFLAEEFDLSGGRIKNAVLRAAYRARQNHASLIGMEHLWGAAVEEARAAGKVVRGGDMPEF